MKGGLYKNFLWQDTNMGFVYREQKVSDPLGLELQIIVSHHVGVGNKPGSSGRTAHALTSELSLQPSTWALRR